jgi:hypothetical protein
MTYSACDFNDSIMEGLTQSGGIHKKEARDPKLDDNLSLQADYALRAIDRFEEVRDAAEEYRTLAKRAFEGKASEADREKLGAADTRLRTALKAVKKPKAL